MPYIDQALRPEKDAIVGAHEIEKWSAGELNYFLTRVLLKWMGTVSYMALVEALGTLVCVGLELYRRVATPYEDRKRDVNGEVYL